jgi:uncharacterized protein (TIGR00725 family)
MHETFSGNPEFPELLTSSPQPLIAVCGPGATATPELEQIAQKVGLELARAGYGVVCGGRGGVMAAACKGAKEADGLTVGILPGYDRAAANPFVDIVICTGLGEARNMLVVASGLAVIAVGGEWGTLSEIALARKIGRPVVSLAGYGWHLSRAGMSDPVLVEVIIAENAAQAVEFAIKAIC